MQCFSKKLYNVTPRVLQLVPERLVPVVQRRLELVRAGANKAEQSNSWSEQL